MKCDAAQLSVWRATQRVIDGDTLEVDIDLGLYTWVRRQSIRLANVWAPELNTDAGVALQQRVAAWLPAGSQLVIETQKSRREDDVRSFTRWVAEAWIAGSDVSVNATIQAMIAEVKVNGGLRGLVP